LFNCTTIGLGLGGPAARLLAWGLGSWVEVEIVIQPSRLAEQGAGGLGRGWVEPAIVTFRVRLGERVVEKRFEVPVVLNAMVTASFIRAGRIPKMIPVKIIVEPVESVVKVEVKDYELKS
jgi:hypothetical protein